MDNKNVLSQKQAIFVLFAIALVSQVLFAISISPLSPFEGYDSCVFKQMGLALLQGKVLYIDLFDHKGPVIYLIDALGLMAGRWGIFLLTVLNCTATLYVWYKIASHYTKGWVTFLPVIFALTAYVSVMEEGNMTEDWSLLPSSYCLYLLSRHLSEKSGVARMEFLLMGICAGIITFIRMNNMSIICCVVLFFMLEFIYRRAYRELLCSIFYMFLGYLSVAAACMALFYGLYGQEGMAGLLYGTFLFNLFDYSGWGTFYDFFVSCEYNHWFFFAAILICIYSYMSKEKDYRYIMFFLVCFLFCFFTMGRAGFRHYMIVSVPLFAMGSAYAFRANARAYVLLTVMFILANESFLRKQIPYTIGGTKRAYQAYYVQTDSIIEAMSDEEKACIWNYNTLFDGIGILQRKNITQCNRVILPFQLKAPTLQETEKGRLQKDKPMWLLMNPKNGYISEGDSLFIACNYLLYKMTNMQTSTKNTKIDIEVDFYKRK